eukprot:jgi/Psemu1/209599/e_gw1.505.40.1
MPASVSGETTPGATATAGAAAAAAAAVSTKGSFGSRIRGFLCDSLRSRAVVVAFWSSVLLSFSMGLTVGIMPRILTDRYARLYHGSPPSPPCWEFDTDSMPEACSRGADDAQTGSAWATFVMNLLVFFCNASIGSYSDSHGRRGLVLVSVFLNGLTPTAMLLLERIETMNPFWLYASSAVSGVVSYSALVFAALSDGCPEEYRAGRFATILAGFYFGYATGPTLALGMSHRAACGLSASLSTAALPLAAAFWPETLPPGLDGGAENNNDDDDDDDTGRTGCCKNGLAAVAQPLREMAILNRERVLRLLALASFLAAAVYSTDASLVLFYIEDHLGVNEHDIAGMFVAMGLAGVVLQGIVLQPLVYLLGEHGLLVLSFASGTIHNLLYGLARSETVVTIALSLSQVTKLGYPVLSSLASQQVGPHEQGRVQGALLALNALGGAVGPVAMNRIYERTESPPGLRRRWRRRRHRAPPQPPVVGSRHDVCRCRNGVFSGDDRRFGDCLWGPPERQRQQQQQQQH